MLESKGGTGKISDIVLRVPEGERSCPGIQTVPKGAPFTVFVVWDKCPFPTPFLPPRDLSEDVQLTTVGSCATMALGGIRRLHLLKISRT